MLSTVPTRVLHAGKVWNGDLVKWVTLAARAAVRSMRWPDQLPAEDAPRIVHQYIRERIRYKAEPPSDQVVRLPSATVKEGVADCKSTAVFIAGAAAAAGHHVVLRFIKQNGGPAWSHVYAVVDGVPVDPLMRYGAEAVSSQAKDVPLTL